MGTPTLWAGFTLAVLTLLALDLWVFHRGARRISLIEAAIWSAVWVSLSLAFNYWILRTHGSGPALAFFTGYLVEKSLSADNLFIFVLVFRAFGIEPQYQHRALFWGVLGALFLRGIMVGLGTALISHFSWILYLFGALLVFAAGRMLFLGHPQFDLENGFAMRWARRVFPIASGNTGLNFFVTENGRRAVTRLFLAVLVIEGADLIFALDSIPAVFGITRDPFLVYTSNVCAILGLRSFYTLLAGMLPLFRFLDTGIAAVLLFIGGKMLAEPWIHIPTPLALSIVGGLLGIAIVVSLIAPKAKTSHA